MSKNQRKAWRKLLVLVVQYNAGVYTNEQFLGKFRVMLKAYQEKWHPDLSFA